jgi:hypothetical protein
VFTDKRLYISILIFIILALSLWFIVLDFSRFFSLNYDYDIWPSAMLKRINVLLAVAIAWAVGNDGLSLRDSKSMKAALLFAFLGEAIFLTGSLTIGICMFALCQTLLIIRHSAGMRSKFAHASYKQKLKLLLTSLMLLLILIAIPILFSNLSKINSSIIIIYIYGILLSISLWAGLACNILGLLPSKNSRMAAIGMFCFYCCDILVGLDVILPVGLFWLWANSFIWVFYIPALVLLALSCYSYDS